MFTRRRGDSTDELCTKQIALTDRTPPRLRVGHSF